MKHLKKQYSHFFCDRFHVDDISLYFPSGVHFFLESGRTNFFRLCRIFIETNRIAISVGFFMSVKPLKNYQ